MATTGSTGMIRRILATLALLTCGIGCRTTGVSPGSVALDAEGGTYSIQSRVDGSGSWADIFVDTEFVESLPCQTFSAVPSHGITCKTTTMQFSMVNANGLKTNRLYLADTGQSVYFSCSGSTSQFACQQDDQAGPPPAVDPSMPMVKIVKVVTTQKTSAQFIDPMTKTLLETGPRTKTNGVASRNPGAKR